VLRLLGSRTRKSASQSARATRPAPGQRRPLVVSSAISPQQLRQLGDVGGDAPGLVAVEGGFAAARRPRAQSQLRECQHMGSIRVACEHANYLNGTEFALVVSYDKRICTIVADIRVVAGGREAADEVEEV